MQRSELLAQHGIRGVIKGSSPVSFEQEGN